MQRTLILLPGLLNDARLWQYQLEPLRELCQPSVGDLTVADSIAALASDVLDHAPTSRFALVGLSMGGYVALEIMRMAPERVSGLALIDTSARPDTQAARHARLQSMDLAQTDFPAVLDGLLPKLLHPHHLADPGLVALIRSMALQLGPRLFQRQQRAIMSRQDSRPHLHQIGCPTLILCGREDSITPLALHEELQAGIAGAELVTLSPCGHLSPLSQPAQVSAALWRWLASLPPD